MNLVCDIYHNMAAVLPPAGPPALVAVPCQLQFRAVPNNVYVLWGMMGLVVPMLTDIASARGLPFPFNDLVECPQGSGRFYEVLFVDDFGKGFANEHRIAMMTKIPPWPVPTP